MTTSASVYVERSKPPYGIRVCISALPRTRAAHVSSGPTLPHVSSCIGNYVSCRHHWMPQAASVQASDSSSRQAGGILTEPSSAAPKRLSSREVSGMFGSNATHTGWPAAAGGLQAVRSFDVRGAICGY